MYCTVRVHYKGQKPSLLQGLVELGVQSVSHMYGILLLFHRAVRRSQSSPPPPSGRSPCSRSSLSRRAPSSDFPSARSHCCSRRQLGPTLLPPPPWGDDDDSGGAVDREGVRLHTDCSTYGPHSTTYSAALCGKQSVRTPPVRRRGG